MLPLATIAQNKTPKKEKKLCLFKRKKKKQANDFDTTFEDIKKTYADFAELEKMMDKSKRIIGTHPKVEHPNLVKLSPEQTQQFLDTHNIYRANVGAANLVWNENLANFAAEWVVINGEKNCKMTHRTRLNYGENLFWSGSTYFKPYIAVKNWGSEIENYNGEVIGKTKGTVGHYTQMVWQNTTDVGCAVFMCENTHLVICNYFPAGNWRGEYPYE